MPDARVGAQVQGENAAANGQPPVEALIGAPGDDQVAPVGGVAGELGDNLLDTLGGVFSRKYKCL